MSAMATNVDIWKRASPTDNFSWQSLGLCSADTGKFLCKYVTTEKALAHRFDSETKLQSKQLMHATHWNWSNSENLPLSEKLWHLYFRTVKKLQ